MEPLVLKDLKVILVALLALVVQKGLLALKVLLVLLVLVVLTDRLALLEIQVARLAQRDLLVQKVRPVQKVPLDLLVYRQLYRVLLHIYMMAIVRLTVILDRVNSV
jgi:hypothetical protein